LIFGDEMWADGLARAGRHLRAAQPHVVVVLPPAARPAAARHDDVQGVALRAGGRDQVAALSGRQRARGLGAKRRGGAENERERAYEHEMPHGHTLRWRKSATEYGGCQLEAAPTPSR